MAKKTENNSEKNENKPKRGRGRPRLSEEEKVRRRIEKNKVLAELNEDDTPVITVRLGSYDKLKKAKSFTAKRRREFLEELIKEFSISRAAAKVGVPAGTVRKAMESDPVFRDSIDQVRDAWLDQAEAAGLKLASLATRDGFNDRKFFLTSHRPETYSDKIDVRIEHKITVNNAIERLRDMIGKSLPEKKRKAIKADYRVL